jgi:hypothetical protein
MGLLEERDFISPRTTASLASINSMMKARKELVDGHESEYIANRLEIAEEVFLISWLTPTAREKETLDQEVGAEGFAKAALAMLRTSDSNALSMLAHRDWADQRWAMGEAALERWRAFDPYKYAFMVKV